MRKNLIYDGVEIPHYQIDTEGNVFRKDGYQMTLFVMRNGYKRVKLSVGIKRGMYLVHRLVASTFIENPDGLPIVNHKNNDRGDNRVSNLEWCTNSHNQKQRFKTHKPTKMRAIRQIDRNTGEVIAEYECMNDAARALGIDSQNIGKCARGERNHAGGFKWEYID